VNREAGIWALWRGVLKCSMLNNVTKGDTNVENLMTILGLLMKSTELNAKKLKWQCILY